MRLIFLAIFSLLFQNFAFSQGCCSGGGSNPIAGGNANGVLQKYQMEVSLNYQNSTSNKFLKVQKKLFKWEYMISLVVNTYF